MHFRTGICTLQIEIGKGLDGHSRCVEKQILPPGQRAGDASNPGRVYRKVLISAIYTLLPWPAAFLFLCGAGR